MYPEELKYSADHEWVRVGEAQAAVRIGVSHFAQEELGGIVYVTLPGVGETITAGEPCGELESHKSVSEIYAPLSGEVTAVNEALDATPELINSDPYGEGWLLELVPSDPDAVDGLLSAADYQAGLGD